MALKSGLGGRDIGDVSSRRLGLLNRGAARPVCPSLTVAQVFWLNLGPTSASRLISGDSWKTR